MSCSNPRQTRFASRAVPFLLLIASAGAITAAAAQQPTPGSLDESTIGLLASLLAAADARRFDAAVLREGLTNPNSNVRRQAALAAGRIGDPEAVDVLIPVLTDSVGGVQAAAAFALGLLKDPRAIPALQRIVGAVAIADIGPPQLEAVTAIAKIGEEDGARALSEILASGSPASPSRVVDQALLEAWRVGPRRAPVRDLVRFADATDAGARAAALFSLARLHAPAGAAALIRALGDQDVQVRAIAARGVSKALLDSAKLDPRATIDGLRALLTDADARVRINAARALASFHDSSVVAAVTPLLADRDIGVAVQAETTLGVLRGSAAIAALRPRLANSVFALRRQALIALAQADSAAGVAAVTPLATDADWRWRAVAAEVYGAAHARDHLEAQLTDPDGRVVAQALQALQRIVPAADTALLRQARGLLTHADPAVRSVAADLLGRRPDINDVDLLVAAYGRAQGDPFNDARLSAVAALGAIAASSASGRVRVAARFVSAVPRPEDYLVRRLAADTMPDVRDAWGPVTPLATGRTMADYRDIARRWLAPGFTGNNPHIFLETDRGILEIELLPTEAPITVAAFLDLVERRFFDGLRWHRVVPNFVVQDGDPRGDGWGGPGFVVRDEINPVRYNVGTVGMALSGPDTGGSQYFITHSAQPQLDGTYTVFGRIVAGVPILDAIGQGDRIRSIHR
ncbi:MAG TPA: HEAT repeat domain-containing protein [Gemmatimonadales bacterium]|nr:HEAT repeat domain-containing protein [Gemmatimonadales bacterium]